MTENKIRMPERRYEIDEPSEEVSRRVKSALGRTATILNIRLADVYDGDLPIPDEILQREIEFSTDFIARSHDGIRAVGRTSESLSSNVTITIPGDTSERSTLRLLETTPPSTASEE